MTTVETKTEARTIAAHEVFNLKMLVRELEDRVQIVADRALNFRARVLGVGKPVQETEKVRHLAGYARLEGSINESAYQGWRRAHLALEDLRGVFVGSDQDLEIIQDLEILKSQLDGISGQLKKHTTYASQIELELADQPIN